MKANSETRDLEDSFDEISDDDTSSVDDFIKELEAKEKDLHITSDMRIEIAESEFDFDNLPAYVAEDLPRSGQIKSAAQPSDAALTKHNSELEREVARLESRIAELKAERRETQEKNDRRVKDFENFRYRVDRERRGAYIEQIGNLASQMLPVLDNLERALESADEIVASRSPEFKQFFDGIVLVNQQLREVFTGMGVEAIATVGERFDPNFHEAVATETRNDMPGNTVCGEMLRGYRIGNKVIRHSMVKVTTSPVERPMKQTDPETSGENVSTPETE